MKVVSAEQMRAIDLAAQQRGISGFYLMRKAGEAIAVEAARVFSPNHVTVLCGKGNNAGDGFRCAIHLEELGISCKVLLAEESPKLPEAAARTFEELQKSGIPCTVWKDKSDLTGSDLIIDCLLGTGITGPARQPYASIIESANQSRLPIVSADLPSGLRALAPDEDPEPCIRANLTVAIGLPKQPMLEFPGCEFAGRIIVAPINFPQDLLKAPHSVVNYATSSDIAALIPRRPTNGNKGTFGSVAVVAGSPEYAGATILTLRATLRAGCGLAACFTPPELNTLFKMSLPEATSILLSSDGSADLDWQIMQARLPQFKVLAIGTGLGTSKRARRLVQHVVSGCTIPLVIDADALNILASTDLSLLKGRHDSVLTPHPGEMARLLKCSTKDVQQDRVEAATRLARELQTNIVLKGASTIVARHDGQAWIVPGASSALGKAGTGDVLTGIIAALIAQGTDAHSASLIATTIHLEAGKACAQRTGPYAVLASEVADEAGKQLDRILSQYNHEVNRIPHD